MNESMARATVRVLYEDPERKSGHWDPAPGSETYAALERVFDDQKSAAAITVREEAIATLSNCLPPEARLASTTGLVIGYVQSGKTLAFTVLSALAHDNGYPLIVILTGTIKNLFRQSTERLKRDLGASDGGWQFYTSEHFGPGLTDQIASYLRDWDRKEPWVLQETVVLTVLKHGTHLDRVAGLLEQLCDRGVLKEIPVLIIDDEADQAGLNTLVRKRDQSPTYRRILRLRSALQQHSYLQYTATPQAILLVSLMDELSPEFVQILTPGAAYTGGQTFFGSERDLIKTIPDIDLTYIDELRDHPPETLRDALASFLVSAAAGALEKVDYRSMMVHPHRLTEYHAKSVAWLRGLIERWRYEVTLPHEDPDRKSIEEELQLKHEELKETTETISPWEEVRQAVPYVLNKITVHELNTRSSVSSTAHIDWDRERFTILVGGQKLDRGYTVRGLTTTYMPRSLGVGNADTVQQRARWFGYKEDYLGLCRVYLRKDVARAYRRYVDHEENIRQQLSDVMDREGSLQEWRRSFFLDRDLKPTRSSVVGRKLLRGGGADWFVTSAPSVEARHLSDNRRLVGKFCERLNFERDVRSLESSSAYNLRSANVSVGALLSHLVLDWRVTDGVDSAERAVAMLQLQHAVERDPGLSAVVYVMRPELQRDGGSRRQVTETGRIENVFQGESVNYPGDRYLEPTDQIVAQIHSVNMVDDKESIQENVPVLALHIPARVASDWLAEVPE